MLALCPADPYHPAPITFFVREAFVVSQLERETGALFGPLWAGLSDEQYRASVELFVKRAQANDFDLDWLKGKTCLDAGCGSGRYSVAMALHGAGAITAVDVSDSGLAEARRRARDFPQISFQQASVLQLPFADASFDFVWSAGVIHHTADFDRALGELVRVLRPGGKLFLLVYGAGGLRWKAIKALRPIMADLGAAFVDAAIQAAGLPANNRKHFMDDLFVPVQLLTDWQTFLPKLHGHNLCNIMRWTGNTFDQEQSPDAQLEDLVKLLAIAASCEALAGSDRDRYLGRLAKDAAQLYVDTAKRAMIDASLSAESVREIVIGQGNHRVVAEKAPA